MATPCLSGLLAAICACEQTVVVATRLCPDASTADPGPNPDASVRLPWSTGFEDGFCDYSPPMGFCIFTGAGSYSLVTSPVHSGQFAAAFTVHSDVDGGSQSRCVLQGVFPKEAYYGAWYYVPASAVNNNGVWNLLHFQGGVSNVQRLWDISLVNPPDGGDSLNVVLYNFHLVAPSSAPRIPIGKWFHLEVYFKRANDTTGELTAFQDGVPAGRISGMATDATNWGQWFVGNFAGTNALTPPGSTIFVDDVTISSVP